MLELDPGRKDSLNIAVIAPYSYIELYHYLSFYGNVFVQTYEPYYNGPYLGDKLRLLSHNYLHGIAGYIGWKLKSGKIARVFSKLFNPRHRFQPIHIARDLGLANPEKIDILIVVELLCRYDLRPFRNAVKIFWAIDSFNERRLFMYRNVVNIEDYDIVFAAHDYGVRYFRDNGIEARLLPLALRYEWIYRPLKMKKSYDVVFVGRLSSSTHSRRMKILREIVDRLRKKNVNVFYTAAWHHDAARLYNSSKIVLNVTRAGEINLRLFEVLGTRSFLINDDGEVRLLFEPGKELEVFTDPDEAVMKILEHLEDDEARERVAAAGHRAVLDKHTMYHRVEGILEVAGFKVEQRWSRVVPMLLQSIRGTG